MKLIIWHFDEDPETKFHLSLPLSLSDFNVFLHTEDRARHKVDSFQSNANARTSLNEALLCLFRLWIPKTKTKQHNNWREPRANPPIFSLARRSSVLLVRPMSTRCCFAFVFILLICLYTPTMLLQLWFWRARSMLAKSRWFRWSNSTCTSTPPPLPLARRVRKYISPNNKSTNFSRVYISQFVWNTHICRGSDKPSFSSFRFCFFSRETHFNEVGPCNFAFGRLQMQRNDLRVCRATPSFVYCLAWRQKKLNASARSLAGCALQMIECTLYLRWDSVAGENEWVLSALGRFLYFLHFFLIAMTHQLRPTI